MSTHLDPAAADRLRKLCAMFSSNFGGERASAAALADKLLRSQGLTWPELIRASASRLGVAVENEIDFALRHGNDMLTGWEEGFLRGVRGRQFLTEKQLARLGEIVAKVARARAEVRR